MTSTLEDPRSRLAQHPLRAVGREVEAPGAGGSGGDRITSRTFLHPATQCDGTRESAGSLHAFRPSYSTPMRSSCVTRPPNCRPFPWRRRGPRRFPGTRAGFLPLVRCHPRVLRIPILSRLIAIVPVYLLLRRLYGRWAGVVGIVVIMSSPVVVTTWAQRLFELRCHLVHDRRSRCSRSFVGGASLGEALALQELCLFTMAVWSNGFASSSCCATLVSYLGLRLLRDRPQLGRDMLALGAGGGADHRGLGRVLGMAARAVGLHKSEHQIGASPEQSRTGGSVPLHQLGLGSLRRLPADPARHRGLVLPSCSPAEPV